MEGATIPFGEATCPQWRSGLKGIGSKDLPHREWVC